MDLETLNKRRQDLINMGVELDRRVVELRNLLAQTELEVFRHQGRQQILAELIAELTKEREDASKNK